MDEKQLAILTGKMDSLLKMLALNLVAGKSVNDQVDMLTKAGIKAGEIADILDKTENQIYVTQNALRKAKKKEAQVETTSQPSQQQQETEGNTNV